MFDDDGSVVTPKTDRQRAPIATTAPKHSGKAQFGSGASGVALSRVSSWASVDVAVIDVHRYEPAEERLQDRYQVLILDFEAAAKEPEDGAGLFKKAVADTLANEVVGPIWRVLPQISTTPFEAAPTEAADAIQSVADACHEFVEGRPIDMLGAAAGIPPGPLTIVHAVGVNVPLPGDDGVAFVKLAIQVTGVVLGVALGMPHLAGASLKSLVHDELAEVVSEAISSDASTEDRVRIGQQAVADRSANERQPRVRARRRRANAMGTGQRAEEESRATPELLPPDRISGRRDGSSTVAASGLETSPFKIYGISPDPVGNNNRRQSRIQRSNGPTAGP